MTCGTVAVTLATAEQHWFLGGEKKPAVLTGGGVGRAKKIIVAISSVEHGISMQSIQRICDVVWTIMVSRRAVTAPYRKHGCTRRMGFTHSPPS